MSSKEISRSWVEMRERSAVSLFMRRVLKGDDNEGGRRNVGIK